MHVDRQVIEGPCDVQRAAARRDSAVDVLSVQRQLPDRAVGHPEFGPDGHRHQQVYRFVARPPSPLPCRSETIRVAQHARVVRRRLAVRTHGSGLFPT
jgi:hypothetical protein